MKEKEPGTINRILQEDTCPVKFIATGKLEQYLILQGNFQNILQEGWKGELDK